MLCSLLLLLGGCANNNQAVQGVSSAVFAAGGAYGGYQACKKSDRYTRAGCAAMGGIAGAIIGNFVGSKIVQYYMDNADKQQLNQALSQRSPRDRQWRNPQTGTVFRVSDIRAQENCRTFTLQATDYRQQSTTERHQACGRNGAYI
jgi:MFS family permease